MSLAEKYYRKFYKIKPEVKITNDQWKVINMMHECLREYNTPKLPYGSVLINKIKLVEHLRAVKKCCNATDKLMARPEHKEFSNGKGGSDLATIWNILNMTLQEILHFQLNVPLDRVSEEITDELIESSESPVVKNEPTFLDKNGDKVSSGNKIVILKHYSFDHLCNVPAEVIWDALKGMYKFKITEKKRGKSFTSEDDFYGVAEFELIK